jgi:CP family cyanate transporter-like MFS transporter
LGEACLTKSDVYRAIVAAGILVLALNLRAAVVAISPLLHQIQADLGLTGGEAGLLTTLPVACFGLFSPLAPALARRIGIERTLFCATLLIVGAFVLRLAPATAALYAGTLLAGIAIAIGNVLVPVLIKRDFVLHSGTMTAAYISALSFGPSLAAGLTIPIQRHFGLDWRGALFVWVALPLLTLVVWLPQLRSVHRVDDGPRISLGAMMRSRLAWQVTLFMGLQSLGFYATVAWLPTLYIAHGVDAAHAGGLLSLANVVALPVVLTVPIISARMRDQTLLVWLMGALNLIGLLGITLDPVPLAVLWVIVLGAAQAMTISLAITFIMARSPDGEHAAQLSSMAQGIGYTMAAFGPFLFGVIRDGSGGYTVPMLALVAVVIPLTVTGIGAAQPRFVRLARAA